MKLYGLSSVPPVFSDGPPLPHPGCCPLWFCAPMHPLSLNLYTNFTSEPSFIRASKWLTVTCSVPLPRGRYWERKNEYYTGLVLKGLHFQCFVYFAFPSKASTVPCPPSVLDDHCFGEWTQAWKGGPGGEESRVQPLSNQAPWPHNQWLTAMFPTRGIMLPPFSLFKATRPSQEACQTKHLDCPFYEGEKNH